MESITEKINNRLNDEKESNDYKEYAIPKGKYCIPAGGGLKCPFLEYKSPKAIRCLIIDKKLTDDLYPLKASSCLKVTK